MKRPRAIHLFIAIVAGLGLLLSVGQVARAETAFTSSGPTANRIAPVIQTIDLTPGRQIFPPKADSPAFTIDDELILQIRIEGVDATDTIVAYGTREAVYLPLGEMARILDLAIRVSDDGHYASGWFLSEDRTLVIDLRQSLLQLSGEVRPLAPASAVAYEGELYVRAEMLASLFPLEVEPDLRAQAVRLKTLEPFPFEERLRREAARARLAGRNGAGDIEKWPREAAPWQPISVPMADVDLRALSDSARGSRIEGDIRLSGDLAYLTAQSYFSATTRDGLVASLIELGRRDPDRELIGPLHASAFQMGDVATSAMPMGLRGVSGRGAYVTNSSLETVSIFDQIDLRGVLPDGFEVELYRNGALFGSTRDRVNGQYEFLQVPLDYGLNVFRFVFYGPQGQRREEVRKISVGDGRLGQGELVYSLDAVQRGVNLLGVTGPDFYPTDGYGDWQSVGRIAYGINSSLTGVLSSALFEDQGISRFLVTTGLRTGIGGVSIRADAGISDHGGHAGGLGLGGRALGGAGTISHFEYGGGFIDELRSLGRDPLRRATELDFNTSVSLGGISTLAHIPLTLRARRIEYLDGRERLDASMRGSARLPGIIASTSIDYSQSSAPDQPSFSQLMGDFDLATFNRSRTQLRGSVGYRLHPDPEITHVSGSVDYALDESTGISGSASYALENDDLALSVSAIRQFEKFTLSLDSQYDFGQKSYSIGLRIGFSFGRDPLRQRLYADGPGKATSGAVALQVFHDLDGDHVFGPGDEPLQGVDFSVQNAVATSDVNGFARLAGLGNGIPVVVQVDPSTLPDILMAPASRGIEVVPRAGRIQELQFPIVTLSEIEGSVRFDENGAVRGVSGLRLQLRNDSGDSEYAVRTERDGYYFLERVKPGNYVFAIDPEQAERLNICIQDRQPVVITPKSEIVSRDVMVASCKVPSKAPMTSASVLRDNQSTM